MGLVRTLANLVEHGVAAPRLVPVVNRAPRGPKGRAEVARALAELTAPVAGTRALASPVFLPDRRHLDLVLRDVAPLSASLVGPVTGAVAAVLARPVPAPQPAEPEPVTPGSLGRWTTADELAH
jgi:hypothetical protein